MEIPLIQWPQNGPLRIDTLGKCRTLIESNDGVVSREILEFPLSSLDHIGVEKYCRSLEIFHLLSSPAGEQSYFTNIDYWNRIQRKQKRFTPLWLVLNIEADGVTTHFNLTWPLPALQALPVHVLTYMLFSWLSTLLRKGLCCPCSSLFTVSTPESWHTAWYIICSLETYLGKLMNKIKSYLM